LGVNDILWRAQTSQNMQKKQCPDIGDKKYKGDDNDMTKPMMARVAEDKLGWLEWREG